MASSVKLNRIDIGSPVFVGERVKMDGSDGEFVVVSVDRATGSLELLQLRPGEIKRGIPVSSVRRTQRSQGPKLVADSKE